jgi:serine/threonine protein kinase
MSTENRCGHCASVIPAGAPFGLCPVCLLRLGLSDPLTHDSLHISLAGLQMGQVDSTEMDLDDLASMRQLGAYRVLRELGRGGMGVVYHAQDLRLKRDVALKVLKDLPVFSSKESIDRFLREARAAARINHPNIVTVYEAWKEGDTPYIAMEFIDGQTLDDRVNAAGPLSVREASQIVVTVAEALADAHSHAVIHRDIKPHNIMEARNGRIIVTDFGLAKLLENTVGSGSSSSVMGTPLYMSPEQCEGGAIDHRTDIFSLGLVYIYLLTGRLPYKSSVYGAIINEKLTTHSVELLRLAPHLPAGLDTIVKRMTARNPMERYETAAELAEAVRAFCENRTFIRTEIFDERTGLASSMDARRMQHSNYHPTDVNIVYSTQDNRLSGNGSGWVETVRQALELRIHELTGWTSLSVTTHTIEEICESLDRLPALRSDAVVVFVLSPNMAASLRQLQPNVRENLLRYLRVTDFDNKLAACPNFFKILRLPIEVDVAVSELNDFREYRFFETQGQTGVSADFWPNQGDGQFFSIVNLLAHDLRRSLGLLKSMGSENAVTTISASAPSNKAPSVFLAEVADDLESYRSQIEQSLKQRGYIVRPLYNLPLTSSAELANVVRAELEHTDLSIHFLGEHYGRRPAHSDKSLTKIQLEEASKSASAGSLQVVSWLREGLTPDQIIDERQFSLVEEQSEQLLRCSVEELKTIIHESLEKVKRPILPPSGGKFNQLVYISHQEYDHTGASQLREYLVSKSVSVAMPLRDGDSKTIRKDFEQFVSSSDGLVIYYGKAPHTWVRQQWLQVRKGAQRRGSKPMPVLGVYFGPPPVDDKDELTFTDPDLVKIVCTDRPQPDAIDEFISLVRERAAT